MHYRCGSPVAHVKMTMTFSRTRALAHNSVPEGNTRAIGQAWSAGGGDLQLAWATS